ncbi:MAG: MarR family transcriptional regulator [Candidatus Methanomethylophilaceae archaeon]|nr:MarR family transcriptional regulator [Candidatus Methanomethylophilaceae archaeon]
MPDADDEFDCLKLENQICFPLYVCAKEIVRRYTPYLDRLGLTYTQYLVMMALWEHGTLSVKGLGSLLFLDSGTLTPLLKKTEEKGFVARTRDPSDERTVLISLTGEGEDLKKEAKSIPYSVGSCLNVPPGDVERLYRILWDLLGTFRENVE